MVFSDLYGTDLDTELGTTDRTQRFTTVLRKRYVNEGQRVFNEQTGCFVKRFAIPLVDGTAEYNVEGSSVITAGDYLRPSKTTATLRRYDGAGTAPSDYSYIEGPDLPYHSEEYLNQTRPGWRAETAATPDAWTLRSDGGAQYAVLVPPPDVPTAETWVLLWPYVAQPADMSADGDEPYTASGATRTSLRPYHRGILHYAAANCEKLRKNYEGSERHMKLFAAVVAKYATDQQRPTGSSIRLAQNFRSRLRMSRPMDPMRYQN